jgi:hypothetical protein
VCGFEKGPREGSIQAMQEPVWVWELRDDYMGIDIGWSQQISRRELGIIVLVQSICIIF